ncbi:hypothetical protein [Streptomyces atratus]|uniref:hypothetical protein n=1 Tax=Streptomyces atratus TaxID=1893 RepID=UPI0036564DEF
MVRGQFRAGGVRHGVQALFGQYAGPGTAGVLVHAASGGVADGGLRMGEACADAAGRPCRCGIVAMGGVRRQQERLPAERAITARSRTFKSFTIG